MIHDRTRCTFGYLQKTKTTTKLDTKFLPAIALPPSFSSSLFQPQNFKCSFNNWSFRRQTRLNYLSYGGQLHIKSTPLKVSGNISQNPLLFKTPDYPLHKSSIYLKVARVLFLTFESTKTHR